MLLKELREELKKYNEEDLKNIICELYKSIPKARREEKDIEQIIKDYTAYKSIGKMEKNNKAVNMEELKPQIEQFIEYAYNQYYYIPNKFIHKKERPKWRFIIKNYMKDLEAVPASSEEGKAATDLYKRLYELLSHACAFWTFNTDDPFRSIGIKQTEVLDRIIKRMLIDGVEEQGIKSALMLVINSHVDRETLHSGMIMVLISNLKTSDAKEAAIKQCGIYRKELDEQWKGTSKKSYSTSNSEFRHTEKMNNITEAVFRLYCELCEYDEAVLYFHKNYKERSKEVALYILLELIYEYDLKEYWTREFDRAVSLNIKPREGLMKTYQILKETGEFGDGFYYYM